MRTYFFGLFFIFLCSTLSAQQAGKFRVGLDVGGFKPSNGVTFGCDLDLRYNFSSNLNAGIKFTSLSMAKDFIKNSDQTSTGVLSLTSATILQSDYYFLTKNSNFASFIGGGIGRFGLVNVGFNHTMEATISSYDYSKDYKIGSLIRAGFEYEKFRVAFEYYTIPNSILVNPSGQTIGTYSNRFSNLTLGFYIGGGKFNNIQDNDPYSPLLDFSLRQFSFRKLYTSVFGEGSLDDYKLDSTRNVNAKFYTLASFSVAGFPGGGFRYRPYRQFSTDLEMGIIPADGGGVLCNWSLNYHVPHCAGFITGLTYSKILLSFENSKVAVKSGFDKDIVSPWVGYLFPSVLFSPVNFTVRLGPGYSPHENSIFPYIYLGIGIPITDSFGTIF